MTFVTGLHLGIEDSQSGVCSLAYPCSRSCNNVQNPGRFFAHSNTGAFDVCKLGSGRHSSLSEDAVVLQVRKLVASLAFGNSQSCVDEIDMNLQQTVW
jgi:hypothetical protein